MALNATTTSLPTPGKVIINSYWTTFLVLQDKEQNFFQPFSVSPTLMSQQACCLFFIPPCMVQMVHGASKALNALFKILTQETTSFG